jgi:hypothetical protein
LREGVSWFMVRILMLGDVWREFVGNFHVIRREGKNNTKPRT